MTNEVMSPLRRCRIEDMTIRKIAPKSQQGYIRTVKDSNDETRAAGGAVGILTSSSKQFRLAKLRFVEVFKNWFAL